MALILHYEMNETSGVNAVDSVGSNSASLNGMSLPDASIAGATDLTGTAFRFQNSFLEHDLVTLPGEFTFAFWLYRESVDRQAIAGDGTSDYIRLNSTTTRIDLRFGGNSQNVSNVGFNMPTAEWMHLVIRRDASDVISFFKNAANGGVTTNRSGAFPFRYTAATNGGFWPVNGRLDDYRVYDNALTDQEVSDLYSSLTAPPVNLPAIIQASSSQITA